MIRKGDVIMALFLIASIVTVGLVNKYSWSPEFSILVCGDPYIITHLKKETSAKIPFIQCFPRSCYKLRTTPLPSKSFRCGAGCKVILLIYYLGMQFFPAVLFCCEQELSSKCAMRRLGLNITGGCMTAVVAILLSNLIGTYSPTFIEPCVSKIPGMFIVVNLISFPCLIISLMSYAVIVCLWTLKIELRMHREFIIVLVLLAFITSTSIIGIGFVASLQLGASTLDILSGFGLGGTMGWIFAVKLMNVIYPDYIPIMNLIYVNLRVPRRARG